jgi:hypothetical protein
MKLSAELFSEIVTSLRSDGGSKTRGHEKRTEGRVGLRCALEIAPCSFSAKGSKSVETCVHDISQKGLGLVSSTKLVENSEFVARFTRDGDSVVPVLYRVRYCRRLSTELFAVGAIFQRVLPDASGEIVPLGKRKKEMKSVAKPAEATSSADESSADPAHV